MIPTTAIGTTSSAHSESQVAVVAQHGEPQVGAAVVPQHGVPQVGAAVVPQHGVPQVAAGSMSSGSTGVTSQQSQNIIRVETMDGVLVEEHLLEECKTAKSRYRSLIPLKMEGILRKFQKVI
jgi:hypothetical protein